MTDQNTTGPGRVDIALLVLRLAFGGALIAHGFQKLLDYTVAGVAGTFAGLGIPLAEVAAPLVTALEIVGGAAIVLGIGARLAAALSAVSMVTASLTAHLPNGFFSADGGMELTLLIAAAMVAIAVAGPGRLSLHAVALRGRAPLLA